jgi:hypothetical protein
MIDGILYNGKRFPDYIFSPMASRYLFIEFHFIFTESFAEIFKKFLERNSIYKVLIKNLEPESCYFSDEIKVKDLPASFIESTCTEKIEGYFSFKASLHMITEQSLIYSEEKKELFCIFLDRAFDLAILGFSNPKDVEFFYELSINNLTEYLKMIFGQKGIPESFKEILDRNWKLSVS